MKDSKGWSRPDVQVRNDRINRACEAAHEDMAIRNRRIEAALAEAGKRFPLFAKRTDGMKP